jgi:hypothetical protein
MRTEKSVGRVFGVSTLNESTTNLIHPLVNSLLPTAHVDTIALATRRHSAHLARQPCRVIGKGQSFAQALAMKIQTENAVQPLRTMHEKLLNL